MTSLTPSRPELTGTFGMVTSTHWLATAAGMGVLERGGNAADAAVTTGFTLQVVEPHLNGPGGEVPIILARAGEAPSVLCGQGVAPAAATPQAFADLGLDRVPGTGLLAACVPGSFDAWLLLLLDHGTVRLREVLEPAIGYAEHGHPLLGRVADTIARMADTFREDWPTSAATWMPGGDVPAPGALFCNPALAATYRRIVELAEAASPDRDAQIEEARRVWREGFVAGAIADFVRTPVRDTSGRLHAGLLTGEDLASWRASYEPPASVDYAGFTVHKTGPWGQGPTFLQQLRVLEHLGVGAMETDSAEFVHTVVESTKLAFADREAWYGDPAHVDVPLADLLSPAYAAARAGLVTRDASRDLRPGHPGGREPRLPALVTDVRPAGVSAASGVGEPTIDRSGETRGDTCHLDVVDRWGNVVTATPSGGWLQSSPVIPDLGFALGSRAQMFWFDADSPSVIAPGKRPRTTLSPTLVTRDGEAVLALGTPGGDQQDQWSLIYFLRIVHGGEAGTPGHLQEALVPPMFHTGAFPSSFYPRETVPLDVVIEDRIGGDALAELAARGHRVTASAPWSLGRLSAVARDTGTGLLRAAADPRASGYAAGR